ncbi:kinesin-like protein KIN-10C isoform X6 [Gossypium hirsutum]|uniref:Kinesin-like protein KIN-10C isoform X6 n=1 Tax=Gossypium hirsutum TaxID=3635 RepID=A0ABM2ZD61_GOSHI|nr:kinesin-like protein KIN-10C isoform X6 [Gossypium hirsutum]
MGQNRGRKARVIAKIKGFTDLETESVNEASGKWISVHRPKGDDSETVAVSFGDESTSSRKESYELDYCYDRSEGNDLIFSKEVKPLIEDVFNGYNATVVAYGARGSGKTFTIQGSERKPGLAVLAMAEILSIAEESSKLIAVSCYEILKDHAYDHLAPDRHEVLILEDVARGKIQLKGLSQVPVKSIEEFQKLYLSNQNSHKQSQKIIAEPHHRSHKGLIIHVFRGNESNALPFGKMNFVDLAGYEDAKRKSTGSVNLLENNKINKSIYALHNVVYALNANESHVPYRESKLTRILRDSLGGTNKILMITCLNSSFCQDSMYMANLASRSCKGSSKTIPDSTKKAKSMVRPMVVSSSSKSRLTGTVSATTSKPIGNRVRVPENKANVKASALKGRKLFDEACHSTKPKKVSQEESLPLENVSTITEHAIQKEEKDSSSISEVVVSHTQKHFPLQAFSAEESDMTVKATTQETKILDEEHFPLQAFSAEESDMTVKATTQENTTLDKVNVTDDDHNHDKATPNIDSNAKALSIEADQTIDKENNLLLVNKEASPPISARLQELSNNLKLLYSSTPSCVEIPPKTDVSFEGQVSTEALEPKTPEPRLLINDKSEIVDTSCNSWKTFSARSSRMKSSLVDEYLRFLNTASKEDLKRLKGIGEKRATYILELREESPEPFKDLDDLKEIGLSAKQIKGIMKKEIGELYN